MIGLSLFIFGTPDGFDAIKLSQTFGEGIAIRISSIYESKLSGGVGSLSFTEKDATIFGYRNYNQRGRSNSVYSAIRSARGYHNRSGEYLGVAIESDCQIDPVEVYGLLSRLLLKACELLTENGEFNAKSFSKDLIETNFLPELNLAVSIPDFHQKACGQNENIFEKSTIFIISASDDPERAIAKIFYCMNLTAQDVQIAFCRSFPSFSKAQMLQWGIRVADVEDVAGVNGGLSRGGGAVGGRIDQSSPRIESSSQGSQPSGADDSESDSFLSDADSNGTNDSDGQVAQYGSSLLDQNSSSIDNRRFDSKKIEGHQISALLFLTGMLLGAIISWILQGACGILFSGDEDKKAAVMPSAAAYSVSKTDFCLNYLNDADKHPACDDALKFLSDCRGTRDGRSLLDAEHFVKNYCVPGEYPSTANPKPSASTGAHGSPKVSTIAGLANASSAATQKDPAVTPVPKSPQVSSIAGSAEASSAASQQDAAETPKPMPPTVSTIAGSAEASSAENRDAVESDAQSNNAQLQSTVTSGKTQPASGQASGVPSETEGVLPAEMGVGKPVM